MNLNPFRAYRERKESAVGFLHAMINASGPVWAPRDYKNFAEEGYAKNVILFRCIFEIAKACSTVPLLLVDRKKGKEEATDHPLMDLLDRPNPIQGGSALLESHYSYKMIAGNAFLEGVRPQPNLPPKELFSLRPDRFSIRPNPNGFPGQYIYTVGARPKIFEVDFVSGKSDIFHDRTFNPTSDWWGMSAIEPGGMAIDQHNEANIWNMKSLQNSAVPTGALELQQIKKKDGSTAFPILKKEQFDTISRRLDERISGSGASGVRGPIFLEGGFKWIQMALSQVDMDWGGGLDRAARNICHSVGFPPQLLGIPGDNTYSNYKEARLALYELTVLVMVNITISGLNNWLVPMFDPRLKLVMNLDQIEALAPRRLEVWEKISKSNFLTINEKREAVGYDLVGSEGDVILVPVGVVPLELAAATDEPDDDDDDSGNSSDDDDDA